MSETPRPDPASPLRRPGAPELPEPAVGEPDDVLIQGHKYDGIREYDNPMPGWWTGLFLLCVAFAPVYVLGIHVFGWFDTYEEDLLQAQLALEATRAEFAASGAGLATTPAALREYAADPTYVAAGAEPFATYCAACHGGRGEGLIGPNLADVYWIHGGRPEDVWTAIAEGFPQLGMTPWEGVLSEEERAAVMAYVLSLQGTDPPNPKAPQGERFEGF